MMPARIPGVRCVIYVPGEKLLRTLPLHIESKDHKSEIFSKAFLSVTFLILHIFNSSIVCFVVLFTSFACCLMSPGDAVQKPPTSTLGGTHDPKWHIKGFQRITAANSHTQESELI